MVATLEVNANDSRSFAKLGDVYRKKRQFEKAAEMYEEAINVDNRAYDHYFVLAEIYEQLHRDEEADKLHRTIVMNAIDETIGTPHFTGRNRWRCMLRKMRCAPTQWPSPCTRPVLGCA